VVLHKWQTVCFFGVENRLGGARSGGFCIQKIAFFMVFDAFLTIFSPF